MATAEELLMATAETETESTEEILVVDLNTRVISIPTTLKILGVESDDDVKRLQFKIPRYYGEFDLSTFDIRINFENARNKGDVYPVDDTVVTDDDYITFSWLVDRVAFNYAGDVKFSICMKLFNNTGMVVKELNTTYATLPVLEGLETEKALVDQNPSAFDQVMYRLYAVEAATGNGQNGYYSVVKVSQVDNGALFTIVNQTGETIAYVKHGEDGYTPVKGVDYWTTEEVTSIKQEVAEHVIQHVGSVIGRYIEITIPVSSWSGTGTNLNGDSINNIPFTCMYESKYIQIGSKLLLTRAPHTSNLFDKYGIYIYDQGHGYVRFTYSGTSVPSSNINVILYVSNNYSGTSPDFIVTDDGEGNVTIS